MANIAVRIENISIISSSGLLHIIASAFTPLAGGEEFSISVEIGLNTTVLAINSAVRQATITAIEAAGYSVGPLDKVFLFGGATTVG